MAANLMENPVKLKKAKAMVAPFAFLSSILLYASIFYIFSFSPSTLFNDNKFWFVISNTLILIIAADYGAFSSSKHQKRDVYEEYALHSQATRRTSTAAAAAGASFVSQYPEIAKQNRPMEEDTTSKEKYKEQYHVTDHQTNNDIPEKILEVVEIKLRTDNSQTNMISSEAQKVAAPMKAIADNGTCHHRVMNKKKTEPKTIRRSKSDKVKHVKTLNDKTKTKGVLHRSNTEKQHNEHDGQSAKDDEFSSMSNEELNRRVEEFIERFNREIRLQGVRNRQVLEFE
ncbi:hypothetical protein like AT2G34610 [Hibiscus trionum]|uniref:DUF4408 domain-containing protein n=1 Tax=Hibiscus trionum TaxID=183268 RepID=A0A9W7HT02_HIBTR|nr:hypothetical protein like AT2G34610 [Hibiscus trionum]